MRGYYGKQQFGSPLYYIYNDSFDDPASRAHYDDDMPDRADYEKTRSAMKVPKIVLPEISLAYTFPILSREQEAHLFRQMNYNKHLYNAIVNKEAAKLTNGAVKKFMTTRAGKSALLHFDKAIEIQKLLASSNYRLLINIIKSNSSTQEMFLEMLVDGAYTLMKSVLSFDYSRGFKFSTYATYSIRNWIAMDRPREYLRFSRYSGINYEFDVALDGHDDIAEIDSRMNVDEMLRRLSRREKAIISLRYGLTGDRPLTLEEIGGRFRLSKERVRQIAQAARQKLRIAFAV